LKLIKSLPIGTYEVVIEGGFLEFPYCWLLRPLKRYCFPVGFFTNIFKMPKVIGRRIGQTVERLLQSLTAANHATH